MHAFLDDTSSWTTCDAATSLAHARRSRVWQVRTMASCSSSSSEFCIEEIDATDLSAARIREIERTSQTRGIGKGGRVLIINEVHGLNRGAIRQLLTTLERIPAHVVWIFTTTSENLESFDDCDDAQPLLSRCVQLTLARQGLAKPFAERVRQIAQAEGLDGRPIGDYVKLLQKHRNNFRAAIVDVESGCMLSD